MCKSSWSTIDVTSKEEEIESYAGKVSWCWEAVICVGGSGRLIGQHGTGSNNNMTLNLKEFGTVQKLKEHNVLAMKE